MPEMPKAKGESKEKETGREPGVTWSDDQEKRGYYYDDAHGYEVFEPDEDESEESEQSDIDEDLGGGGLLSKIDLKTAFPQGDTQ